ncbi:MAG: 4Fe-4S dicluster domain-containing protein, partial [Syntrophothermus sp.]
VDACMTGAMHFEPDGRVVNDPDRCVGCWMCLMVCPFGAITTQQQPKLALKCDRCPDLSQPACVSACPTHALTFAEPNAFAQTKREHVTVRIPNLAGYLAGKY